MKLNKKGFTLIELTISLVLLAVVLVFVMNFYNIVRIDESNSSFDTKIETNTSMISDNINKDIKLNKGIKTVECTKTLCNITLKNNNTRELSLNSNGTVLTYKDASSNEILFSREAIDGYPFSFSLTTGEYIYLITINQGNDYPIEIVSEK